MFILSDDNRAQGSGLAAWPARLTTPPPRLTDFGYSNDMFEKDTVIRITVDPLVHDHNFFFMIISSSSAGTMAKES